MGPSSCQGLCRTLCNQPSLELKSTCPDGPAQSARLARAATRSTSSCAVAGDAPRPGPVQRDWPHWCAGDECGQVAVRAPETAAGGTVRRGEGMLALGGREPEGATHLLSRSLPGAQGSHGATHGQQEGPAACLSVNLVASISWEAEGGVRHEPEEAKESDGASRQHCRFLL